jgi:serine/threonine-protein kinase
MRPGDLVGGKYLLQRRIGEGGMGLVWAARNELTHGPVALKILADPRPEDRARLLREARVIGSLRHPNVVEVYDVGETAEGEPFLVMQLLQGETLRARLRRFGAFPQAQAAEVACFLARGLRAAHQKGIVHRDLKPANVFLHREPEVPAEIVKILDFGVSKHVGSGEVSSTRTGEVVGSPSYMSPEQARGDKQIDHRADLWSLGVVLFEMVAGRRPFAGGNVYTAIAEIVTGPIPHLALVVPGVDPALAHVVDRCLTRERDLRLGSADELLAALAPLAEGPPSPRSRTEPVQPRPPAPEASSVTTAPRVAALASFAGQQQTAPMPPAPMPAVVRAPLRLVSTERMVGAPVLPTSPAARAGKAPPRRASPLLPASLLSLGAVALAAGAFFVGRTGRPAASEAPERPLVEPARAAVATPPAPTLIPWVAPTAGPRGLLAFDAPLGTRVFVDGRFAGIAPVGPLVVPAGEHLLVFQNPALGSRAGSVSVPAGDRADFVVTFAGDAGL